MTKANGKIHNSVFADFQKSEYEHIAEAHFKAIEAISTFFRYYLILMALPTPVLAILVGLSERTPSFEKFAILLLATSSPIFIVVGMAGFCMLMYVINLKMDVVLYSRVVNSIRKFFYDQHYADHQTKLLMRHLPQSAYSPPYRDLPFRFVILTFALFDAMYLCLGLHLMYSYQHAPETLSDLLFGNYGTLELSGLIVLYCLLVLAHFCAYHRVAEYREYEYLRATAIGVDIDGVLNAHRDRFCELALSKLGKTIHPNQIKVLPVHENPELADVISRADERHIFNSPEYWVEMPALPKAADTIREMRAGFLLPVHVFTHRPWPDTLPSDRSDRAAFRRAWRSAARSICSRSKARWYVRFWIWLATLFNYKLSIRYITRYWLYANGFGFDTLLVEFGNENVMHSRSRYENRFNYAKRKRIRFFVEDDWTKAVKLSYICDIVFLIAQPYNEPAAAQGDGLTHPNILVIGKLPANVIRVESWGELKKIIRQLV